MTLAELADHAYVFALQGVPVFPCFASKKPATKHGYLDATTDPEKTRAMFLGCRGAELISMVTGSKTGVVVIDIDPQGIRWFQSHITRFPETSIDETPRKGMHLFYKYAGTNIRNSTSKIANGIDVRGEGGSIIIPPSPGYTTIHEVEMAPLPAWIVRKLTRKSKKDLEPTGDVSGNIEALQKFVAASPEGERNGRLFWASCRLRENIAVGKASVADQTGLLNAAIQCGLARPEAWATIRSGLHARA
jgi:hypothetical protein